jgi:hypothetical protein
LNIGLYSVTGADFGHTFKNFEEGGYLKWTKELYKHGYNKFQNFLTFFSPTNFIEFWSGLEHNSDPHRPEILDPDPDPAS